MEKITCPCGWEGIEDDLEVDFYEAMNLNMAIANHCPKCGNYLLNN